MRSAGDILDLEEPAPPLPSPTEIYTDVLSGLEKGRRGSGDDLSRAVEESYPTYQPAAGALHPPRTGVIYLVSGLRMLF
jgi:hypothetical protein